MELPEFTDRLSVLGFAVGVFLVLAGVATVAGTPWSTSLTPLVGVVQVFGGLAAAAVGVGLAWLTQPSRA